MPVSSPDFASNRCSLKRNIVFDSVKMTDVPKDGSWGKDQQNVMTNHDISDLPWDLENDVAGFVMYPKTNCCIKNC